MGDPAIHSLDLGVDADQAEGRIEEFEEGFKRLVGAGRGEAVEGGMGIGDQERKKIVGEEGGVGGVDLPGTARFA